MKSQENKMAQNTHLNDESQASFNQEKAESQRDKTSFRAQNVAASADKYNPQRIASYPKPIDN